MEERKKVSFSFFNNFTGQIEILQNPFSVCILLCSPAISNMVINDRGRMSTNPLEILTEREQAVIQLLLQGKSNKSIARELRVGTRAIELHLTHIYEKLEVHSRT